MRCLRASIFAAVSFSVSELAAALHSQKQEPVEQGAVAESLEPAKVEEESPWQNKPTLQERKEKARQSERQYKLELSRRRKELQQKRSEERMSLRRGDPRTPYSEKVFHIPGSDYVPKTVAVPDLDPNVFLEKKLVGTVGDDIKSGAIIGAIVGATAQSATRATLPGSEQWLYAMKDAALGTALGALLGLEVGRGRGKPMGFNFTTGDHDQGDVAKSVTKGGLIGLGAGWLAAELMLMQMRMSEPLVPIPGMGGKCEVKEDSTVATGWDLGAYVRKPWYAQSMMESWYQPLDSFDCTEARYLPKDGFVAPAWGAPNPIGFEGKFMIDVRNMAPITNKSVWREGFAVSDIVKLFTGDDTYGFLCARRMTAKHGLFVAPCGIASSSPDKLMDVVSTDPAPKPVNYWVLSYSEVEYGGYAIIVAGQPDLTAPDGTCNFIDNDMKGMWILSRKRQLAKEKLEELKSKMTTLNLDTSEMVDVNQFNCPEDMR